MNMHIHHGKEDNSYHYNAYGISDFPLMDINIRIGLKNYIHAI